MKEQSLIQDQGVIIIKEKFYLCIDLKSFYASIECAERGLDPTTTNLVVADPTRSSGSICLAITPAMKALGIKNRCRVFQIPKNIQYITASPRMKLYIEYSARIYGIYLKYISKEDIQIYSIDEAFLDVTDYLHLYKMSAKDIGIMIITDIHRTLGITASCGIGTNLYLTKIALDISAKNSKDNIAFLDEDLYKKTLWRHRPLTDFWRIGPGTAKKLMQNGIMTMEDVAHCSEKTLYKLFGIDAEYLIDHAWGREPTTIKEIKNYKSSTHSLSSGQVLFYDYTFDEALLIVKEMVDLLCLDLVDKHLITGSISLYVGYSRTVTLPPANGSMQMSVRTNSVRIITKYFIELYYKIVNHLLPVRRINISFNKVINELYEQYDLFTDPEELEKDRNIQRAINSIKKKYGKNAILKGMNLQTDKGSTTIERNQQIGGHKSGLSQKN